MTMKLPACFLLLAMISDPSLCMASDEEYLSETESWRHQREINLKAEDGWLSLAGLHWLKPGGNLVGSGPENQARLPESAPVHLGEIIVEGDKAHFKTVPGVLIRLCDEPFQGGDIRTDDQGGKPDVFSVGTLRLIVIKRGDRLALRVKDRASPVRTKFQGLRWFPVEPSWKILAHLEPHAVPTRLEIETIVGTHERLESPGVAVFEHHGREYRLVAALEDGKLWFVFRDATSGQSTAVNGRQLTVDQPGPDGILTLDFNRTVNLPCAYTPFATCPLPPLQNRLDLAIPAGERKYEPIPGTPPED